MTGGTLGRYRLVELLGRGGMGEVHRAYDTEHHRYVAVKVLPDGLADEPVFVERFRKECLVVAGLRTPHAIPIHDFGEIDGRLYLDMRLVDGRDAAAALTADGPFAADRAVTVIEQIAEVLDEAHSANLMHRDVKPSNILLTDRDFAYLVDFGIAHTIAATSTGRALTATGATVGTFAYMAPERLAGSPAVDGRVDVYALACVLFELLTGGRPFPFVDLPALVAAHLTTPPPAPTAARPDLSPAWDAVIARGMAKDPAQRHGTAGELARDARAALDARRPAGPVARTEVGARHDAGAHERSALPPPPTLVGSPGRERPRRRSWPIAVAVAGVVVIAVVVGVVSTARHDGAQSAGAPASPRAEPSGPAGPSAAIVSPEDAYDAVVLADSPIGYWPLRGSSATVVDRVGGRSGTAEGAVGSSRADGPFAGTTALEFGGAPCDGVNLDSVADLLHPAAAVSVEAWIRTTDTRGLGVVFRARDGGYNLQAGASGVELTRYPADRTARAATVVADGVWHHVVATYDNGGYRIYVDGRLQGEGPPDGSLGYFRSEAAIGRDGDACDGVVPSFRGEIADVAIYPVALSATRVLDHYGAAR